jgi:ubiquinone/menaquinone biosynthesis C-methylase UbiE
MDALRMLEFPKASFDLVNQRAAFTWLRTWEWKKILLEHQRVCRPGGIIRLIEVDVWSGGNSPALTKLCDIGLEAFYNSGRLFNARRDGLTSELAHLMTLHGIENVQTRHHNLTYRPGMAEHESFCKDMYHSFRVALPFLQKWTRVPNDYQEIYQQALKEIQQPDFEVTWKAVTAWGTSPTDGRAMLMRGLQ